MNKSTYHISQMDCPSEENLIRMKLADIKNISSMDFDLTERMLHVFHENDNEEITKALSSLHLGATLKSIEKDVMSTSTENQSKQRKVLWIVLAVNFGFFIVEVTSGLISKSMGLVADSLDMLADALVYGMSLLAVGTTLAKKKKVALFSGLLQIILAILGFSEVIRRFIGQEIMPDFRTMIIISFFALIANAICLWLLQSTKSKEAHIQASVIFSANDVIINMGVIAAAVFVWWFNSYVPDLIIGIIVFLIVIRGAIRILKLAK